MVSYRKVYSKLIATDGYENVLRQDILEQTSRHWHIKQQVVFISVTSSLLLSFPMCRIFFREKQLLKQFSRKFVLHFSFYFTGTSCHSKFIRSSRIKDRNLILSRRHRKMKTVVVPFSFSIHIKTDWKQGLFLHVQNKWSLIFFLRDLRGSKRVSYEYLLESFSTEDTTF